MKTLKFSLLALLIIFTLSCSKDEDTPPDVNTSEMLGEWNLQNFEYDGTTEMSYEGTNFKIEFSGITTESDLVVDFKNDGSYVAHGGYTILLSTEAMDYEVPLEISSSTGDWSITGNKMKFSEGFVKLSTGQEMASEPNELIISEISTNRMVLTFTHQEVIDQAGFENIVNVAGEYVFVK